MMYLYSNIAAIDYLHHVYTGYRCVPMDTFYCKGDRCQMRPLPRVASTGAGASKIIDTAIHTHDIFANTCNILLSMQGRHQAANHNCSRPLYSWAPDFSQIDSIRRVKDAVAVDSALPVWCLAVFYATGSSDMQLAALAVDTLLDQLGDTFGWVCETSFTPGGTLQSTLRWALLAPQSLHAKLIAERIWGLIPATGACLDCHGDGFSEQSHRRYDLVEYSPPLRTQGALLRWRRLQTASPSLCSHTLRHALGLDFSLDPNDAAVPNARLAHHRRFSVLCAD
eukprot:COSAG05_NODE_5741_length_1100_cov_1.430569_2_plen_280_part_01